MYIFLVELALLFFCLNFVSFCKVLNDEGPLDDGEALFDEVADDEEDVFSVRYRDIVEWGAGGVLC